MPTLTKPRPRHRVRCRETTYQPSTLELDRDRGIVRGVAVLGFNSKNGRRYLREAVSAALSKYQGVRCNLNHPGEDEATVDVNRRFGWFEDVRLGAAGLRGTFHYNTAHPFAEQFAWWVENNPAAIGFSHNATGQGEADADGTFVVSEIVEVHSVDLVADPATTKGLQEGVRRSRARAAASFEAFVEGLRTGTTEDFATDMVDPGVSGNSSGGSGTNWKAKLADAIGDLVQDDSKTPDQKWAALKKIFDTIHMDADDDQGDEEDLDEDDEDEEAPPTPRNKMEARRQQASLYRSFLEGAATPRGPFATPPVHQALRLVLMAGPRGLRAARL